MPTKRKKVKDAHKIVNSLVRKKRLARPSTLPCFDCGKRAGCYDHYLGYTKKHQLSIQAVCYSCHGKRAWARGEMWASPVWRKNIRQRMCGNSWNKGRKFTEDHKRKIGEANKGRKSWATGKKFTLRHRANMAKAQKKAWIKRHIVN